MSAFIFLIKAIQNRPNMYLSCKTINALSDFITGYLLAKQEVDLTRDEKLFRDEFYVYIKERNELKQSEHWKDVLLMLTNNNQEDAYEEFFRYFESFNDQVVGL